MKYVVILISGLLLHGATALAQEEANTVAEPTADSEPATQPPEQEAKKRSVYYRKARGWLWIEGIAGVSAYDPDSFGSLSISSIENATKEEPCERRSDRASLSCNAAPSTSAP